MVIAECACSHLGSMEIAKDMIEAAAWAGADAVKFQMYVTEKINDLSLHPFLGTCAFTEVEHRILKDHCALCDIEYMCSAFDIESLEVLDRMKVARIKIPSGQIHNVPYLKKADSLNRPIILSTGMTAIEDIHEALMHLDGNVTIMHCNTAYPTPIEDANTNVIEMLKYSFPNYKIGYSDHTTGNIAAITAVALGAEVIEKHFILSRHIHTPDTEASIEPEELKDFVNCIKQARAALGSGIKKPTDSERPNMFRRDFKKGIE